MALAHDWSELLASCQFPTSGAVDCAVSGGADSLALLVLATAAGCQVTAWHVDHGLRPGSAAEAEVVADAAARYGAGMRAVRVEVEAGPNLEDRARRARFAALPAGVLTGHTADDQAETVLLALLRGAGLDGLAGMRAGTRHPLLGLRRRETAMVCQVEGLAPVNDPSNADPGLRRNRVRHELLPLASAIAERDVAPLLARMAAVVRDDADLLEALASQIDPTDATQLRASDRALAARALRRWLAGPTGGYPPDAATLERVMAVVDGRARACQVAGVGTVARTGGRLRIEPRPGPRPVAMP